MANCFCACVYNNTVFNIFQVRRLPVVPLHESSSGSPVLSLHQCLAKSSGEAQCSRGRVLQHLALNPHITRICGPVSIFAAVTQTIRQTGSLCCVDCLHSFTFHFGRTN